MTRCHPSESDLVGLRCGLSWVSEVFLFVLIPAKVEDLCFRAVVFLTVGGGGWEGGG